uniref:Putative secreted protein n=1 Tax=Ixodes ricinus TaxID=34613 RepID=A0A6B0U9W6_IXORI
MRATSSSLLTGLSGLAGLSSIQITSARLSTAVQSPPPNSFTASHDSTTCRSTSSVKRSRRSACTSTSLSHTGHRHRGRTVASFSLR